eukprot:scpid98999/ scgid24439/ 
MAQKKRDFPLASILADVSTTSFTTPRLHSLFFTNITYHHAACFQKFGKCVSTSTTGCTLVMTTGDETIDCTRAILVDWLYYCTGGDTNRIARTCKRWPEKC